MGLLNCSDSVPLFVLLLDFGTVPRVWHCLFFYWTLELFRQCGIIGFSFFYWTLELFRQCGFICFSMGLWDYSHSVALLMYLLDFGTDQRVWHYLVFYWALELFPQCDIIGFSIALWN
jgi:hypothetical protein